MNLIVTLVVVLCWTTLTHSQSNITARIVCSAKSNNGFCSNINYTSFAIPNFRNGTEEREIETELSSYVILYSSGCSNALVHLLCGYYKPPCFSGLNAEAKRLTPCQELCLYVRSTCEPVIAEYNAASTWPDHLNCDQFPLKGDENGPDCFPNFYALEDYQTRLELPSIRGAPRPPTVKTADRFWSPVPAVKHRLECLSSAPIFSGPPTVQPGVVSVNWTAVGSSDPLVTGVRYALYSQCGAETTFQLIDDDIQGLSYNITTLPSLTQCVLRVMVYSDQCLLDVNSPAAVTSFTTGRGCHSLAVMFSGPPTVQPWIVSISWTAAGFNDPLVTGFRFALYSQCGVETTFKLIDANIPGLFYFITTLPSLTQCVLRVAAYSDHCLLDINGATTDTTEPFTTGSQMQASTNWSSTTTTILSIALTLAGVLTIGTCTLAVLLVVVLVTKKKMAAINTGQQPAKLEMHS